VATFYVIVTAYITFDFIDFDVVLTEKRFFS